MRKIHTYDLGDCCAFAKTNIDHGEPWGCFTETREEGLELLGSAYVVVEQQFQEVPLAVVNGDPERESAKDLEVLIGEVLRDSLCEGLGSLASSRLSLHEQRLWEYVLVPINNTEDKRALVLQIPINSAQNGAPDRVKERTLKKSKDAK